MIGTGITPDHHAKGFSMKLFPRPFSGEADKHRMAALAREFDPINLHVIDLPYRLSSWALDDPDNVGLWFNEYNQLAGWAVLQSPFWTIDYVLHPSVEAEMLSKILRWASERVYKIMDTPFGRPTWFAMVFEEQAARIRALEAAGFQCQANVGEDSWSKVLMKRSNPVPVKLYQPRPGFKVRSLAGQEEVQAYVELHQSVFGSRNMTVGWRTRTLQHSAYRRDLDIVVEAPDGRLAAFCIGWFDEETCRGHVEPLGCDEEFRAQALGRVALAEGLHRLQSLGAKEIYVETDNYRSTAFRLYESFDFQVIQNVLVYRKDYEG